MSNSFNADSTCIALWRFESGALTTDSKGDNDLTASASSPTANASDFQEGARSAEFNGSNQDFHRDDADLSSGFPFKNGSSNGEATFCFWIKWDSTDNERILFKYSSDKGFCLDAWVYSFRVIVGIGTGNEHCHPMGNPTIGQWYHIAVRMRESGSPKTSTRYWNGSTATTYEWSPVGTIQLINDGDFYIRLYVRI